MGAISDSNQPKTLRRDINIRKKDTCRVSVGGGVGVSENERFQLNVCDIDVY